MRISSLTALRSAYHDDPGCLRESETRPRYRRQPLEDSG
jgi:hypothetical protein